MQKYERAEKNLFYYAISLFIIIGDWAEEET